jgi:hypothetical protein
MSVLVLHLKDDVAPDEAEKLKEVCWKFKKVKLVEFQAEQTPCIWTQGSENYDGEWDTSCVNVFWFNDGTPKENEFKFCPFCGHPITQKLYEPEPDEDK